MRNLQTRDIFPFAKMIKKMGIKEEFKTLMTSVKENHASGTIAIELIMLIIENIGNAENEFYEFISPIAEKEKAEIETLSFEDLINMFKELAKDGAFINFFTSSAK